jgi:hypothetical protein
MRLVRRTKSFILIVLAAPLFIIACSKNSEPDPSTNPGPDPDPNPPNPPVVTGCKACEYYPICDGSYFNYLDSLYPGQPVLYTDTLKTQEDTTIGGLVYKKVKRISTRYPSTEYVNCQNGNYSVGGKYGFGLKPIIILKANEPVGATWSQTASTGPTVEFTIIAKGMSLPINGTTYTDIIKVKFAIAGSGSTYTAYYYFAKNIGIVKFEYGGWNFDPAWYHRNYLQSYLIP